MKFDENLRAFRKEKDFSQEYLAERMGVSRQTISKWENGTAMPDLKKLTELAEMFDTSMDELLGTSAPIPKSDSNSINIEDIERYAYSIAKEQIDAFEKKNKTKMTLLSVSIILLTCAVIITNITLLSNYNSIRDEISNINNTHYVYNNDNDYEPTICDLVENEIVEVDKKNPNNIKMKLTYSPSSYAKGTSVTYTLTDKEEKTIEAEQNGNSFVAIIDCDLTKKQKIIINVDDGTNILTETYTDSVVDLYVGAVFFDVERTEINENESTYELYQSDIDLRSWNKNDAKPKIAESYIEAVNSKGEVIKNVKFTFQYETEDGMYSLPVLRIEGVYNDPTVRIKLVDELGTNIYYYGKYSDDTELYSKIEIVFPNGKEYVC